MFGATVDGTIHRSEGIMARSINKLILVGHVGRDPEVQSTSNGNQVAHFSLATDRRIPRENGFEQRTEWHRLTVWGRLAELAQEYVRKGDRLYVEGRIQYDSYERDGVTIPTADVVVRELVMLGSASGRSLSGTALDAAEADEELVSA
jgi:single-strand DNA-binding protein